MMMMMIWIIEEGGRKVDVWYIVTRQSINTMQGLEVVEKRVRTVLEIRALSGTCYHKITLCTAEDVNIEEMFCLCLSQG